MADVMETVHEGVWTFVDDDGNLMRLYPEVIPDELLKNAGKAADAKVTGDELAKKANLLDGNRFSGVQRVDNDTVIEAAAYHSANIVASTKSKVTPEGSVRAAIGFHNSEHNGLTLYFDTDGYLKAINQGNDRFIIPFGTRVKQIRWNDGNGSARPTILVDDTWVSLPTYDEVKAKLDKALYIQSFDAATGTLNTVSDTTF